MRTKRSLLLGAALIMLLACLPGSAGAVYMTFDNLPLGSIEGQHLGVAPDGVTFTSANQDTAVLDGGQLNFGWLSPFNVVSNTGYLINNLMTLTFDRDRGYVAFYGGDAGGDKDHYIAKAYSDSNVLVATFDSGVFGGNNPVSPISYMIDRAYCEFVRATPDIKYVTIEAFSVDFGQGILIDNLEFCHPVPVPPTALLLGSGLLGLGLLRRKWSLKK
jgi:hypothetical protein